MRTYKPQTEIMETGTRIRKSRKDQGFTLLEVIVAISIFSVGLLGVAAMQTSAIRGNFSAGRLTEANTFAMDKLEELMGLPYTDPWLEADGNFPGVDAAGNTHQQNADGFTVRWNITDGTAASDTPVPGNKLIQITVTGRGKTLRLVSLKSQSL
jgi:type IV pilus assembly protein PilV